MCSLVTTKLESSNRKIPGKSPNMWKLHNKLLIYP